MKLRDFGQSRSPLQRVALVFVVGCGLLSTAAPWSVVRLHPAGASASYGFASGPGLQGGQVYSGGVYRAALWQGTAASYVDLNPTGSGRSEVRAIAGTQQVGQAVIGGVWRAGMWSGTAASWLSLHPSGTTWSAAYGTDGVQQVGTVTVGGTQHAGYWTGSPASWVDLHPLGATLSYGYDTYAGVQGGWAQFGVGTQDHAAIWYGTALSFVDLNPTGSTRSRVNGIWETTQAGFATFDSVQRAGIWNGSRDSWVSLHPIGATFSEALDIFGPRQVGQATIGGIPHAIMWEGKAEGYVDLNACLPSHLNSATAASIWDDGTNIYIVGFGWHSQTITPYEALLWIGTVEVHLTGTVEFGDLSSRTRQPNPVVLEFRDPGTTMVVGTRVATLNATGGFDVTVPAALPLDVSIKEDTWLRRTMLVNTGPITLNLVNGDCDKDNEVGIGDYAILSSAYGSAPGEVNWNASADLNRDDVVDIADYAILSSNYGRSGDE
ncbi:MAG: hypothetical protein K1X67_24765 [Fimbriimonadaceae bacterium]|nr:hypothetical protein [Fimbriimonadaceae bacterium]